MTYKKIKIFILSFILKLFLNILFYTCRIKVQDSSLFLSTINKKPILLSVWHQQSLLLAQYVKNKNLPIWAISSTHSDSEILARILTSWNVKLIRGSSTRGWFNVVKQMISLYQKTPAIITVTPDGPKGPPLRAKPGAFVVASKHCAEVFSVTTRVSNYWSLPSWDKTILPKPFSTIYIGFCPIKDLNLKNTKTITENIK